MNQDRFAGIWKQLRGKAAFWFSLIEREVDRADADSDGRISQQDFLRLRRRQAETLQGRPQK